MEYVTLDALYAQTRALETDANKLLLESYADTAETMIRNYTRLTTDEMKEKSENGSTIPAPIVQSVLLMVTHWYENRSATTRQPLSFTALGLDHLLKPYRKFKKDWRS